MTLSLSIQIYNECPQILSLTVYLSLPPPYTPLSFFFYIFFSTLFHLFASSSVKSVPLFKLQCPSDAFVSLGLFFADRSYMCLCSTFTPAGPSIKAYTSSHDTLQQLTWVYGWFQCVWDDIHIHVYRYFHIFSCKSHLMYWNVNICKFVFLQCRFTVLPRMFRKHDLIFPETSIHQSIV